MGVQERLYSVVREQIVRRLQRAGADISPEVFLEMPLDEQRKYLTSKDGIGFSVIGAGKETTHEFIDYQMMQALNRT